MAFAGPLCCPPDRKGQAGMGKAAEQLPWSLGGPGKECICCYNPSFPHVMIHVNIINKINDHY